MTCPRCGAAMPPGAVRCVACGASKSPAVAAGVLTPLPPPTADTGVPINEAPTVDLTGPSVSPRTGESLTPIAPPTAATGVPINEAPTVDLTGPSIAPRTGESLTPIAPPTAATAAIGVPINEAPTVDLTGRPSFGPRTGEAPTGITGEAPTGFPGATGFPTVGGATPSSDDAPTIGPSLATPVTPGGPARPGQLPSPGQNIGPRYLIIRMLGVGGMGAVYHAWDAELGVAVALKVIRPDVVSDPEAAAAIERRFKRELILARQVTHKHVVRIHDIGEFEGLKYITMSYVEGADLATVLRTDGRLPVARALRYARQIAAGLHAAHDAGVVHQDLKPANVMIDKDDNSLIMDFGIAQSTNRSVGAARRVTGTIAYMAPEQARGEPTDQRADIYAFGMMLREMLVGRQAATDGTEALEDLKQRMVTPPSRVRTIDETIPEPVDALVARCLEPDREQRYAQTADLVGALAALDDQGELIPILVSEPIPRWRIAAIGILGAAAIAATFIIGRRVWAPPKPVAPIKILVADFANGTGDPSFDDALEQPLTIAMEEASFVTSYARLDALRLAQSQGVGNASRLDAQTARLVGVRDDTITYVLAGRVASRDGRFDVAVDAIVPADGKVAKSATATAAGKGDVLKAIATLGARMRAELGDTTTNESRSRALETFTAGSLEAMREYSLAQNLQNEGKNDDALAHYNRAIELDPNFGRAYSGAANAQYRLRRRKEADDLWKKAIGLTNRMTPREKYRTIGPYYLGIAGNYELARDTYSKLVADYPSDAGGHSNLALAYFYLLDFKKAAEEGQRAIDLDPKNLIARSNQALYAMYASDFSGAAAVAAKLLGENPTMFKAHLPIAMNAVAKGDTAAAAAAYEAMARTGALGASLASAGRADLAMYAGSLDAAEKELKGGMAADVAAKYTTNAALKHIALAERYAEAGRTALAVDEARAAMGLSKELATVVPAARVMIRAGKIADARALATELENQVQKQNRAYGRILQAEAALASGKTAEAIDLLTAAREFADLWIGRYDLGVAYVQAGHFGEAAAELDECEKRRGEATALFFDDSPTVRYLAALPYWMGRAQEGLVGAPAAKPHYERFLALKTDAAGDPLVADARRRLTAR